MPEEVIYIVSSSGPEDYNPEYVIGPAVPDWGTYCKSLSADAEKRAIYLASTGNTNRQGFVNKWNYSIENNDLSDALVDVLLTKGYRKIRFPSYDIGWRDEEEVFDYPTVVLFNLQHEIEEQEDFIKERLKDGTPPCELDYYKKKAEEAAEQIRKLGGTPKINTELMAKLDKLIGE